jgi:hypothetical protein
MSNENEVDGVWGGFLAELWRGDVNRESAKESSGNTGEPLRILELQEVKYDPEKYKAIAEERRRQQEEEERIAEIKREQALDEALKVLKERLLEIRNDEESGNFGYDYFCYMSRNDYENLHKVFNRHHDDFVDAAKESIY